jgi:hypothetical protein
MAEVAWWRELAGVLDAAAQKVNETNKKRK